MDREAEGACWAEYCPSESALTVVTTCHTLITSTAQMKLDYTAFVDVFAFALYPSLMIMVCQEMIDSFAKTSPSSRFSAQYGIQLLLMLIRANADGALSMSYYV